MSNTNAHIVAMTGSYFRGDAVPVLEPTTKRSFEGHVQLLPTTQWIHVSQVAGIGYHFYQGRYTEAVHEVLDTDKKTILHIPSVQSGESTKDKLREVDEILDSLGDVDFQDEALASSTSSAPVTASHKVADLVNDDEAQRRKIVEYLREMDSLDDMDLIIALGWPRKVSTGPSANMP